MTLLAPWALWLAAVGAGVVALYLLKIKRRREDVPALDFWLDLAGRTRVHSLFDRLKRLLSMLLWLVIVACLVLAVANPILSLGRIKPRAIAMVIDNSASMQTLEDGPAGAATRLELAVAAVGEMTSRRPVSDEWLVIEATREARVVTAWTRDARAARRGAEGLRPFGGAADLAGAVALAGQLVEGKPDPCIVVVSDGGAGAIAALAADDARVMHWPVGSTRDNLGVARLAVRSNRQSGERHALVTVVNASDERVETSLTLEIDGAAHSVELVSIEPGGEWERTLAIDAPIGAEGAALRASLDRPDALALDNEAYAALEPIRPAVVWLVSEKDRAFFFEQALGSMEGLVNAEESLTLAPGEYAAAARTAAEPGSALPTPDLVIFNACAPERLTSAGRFVFVDSWPVEVGARAPGEVEAPQLFVSDRPHPVMRHVGLQGARLAKARRVGLAPGALVLAHTPAGEPLIFLWEDAGREALCMAFDVLESDLPFRNAFPLMLRNTVAFLHADAGAWLRSEHRVGEPVRTLRDTPPGVERVLLTVPGAGGPEEHEMAAEGPRRVFGGSARAGVIRLAMGEERALSAVNIGEASESRIAPTPAPGAEEAARALALSGRLFGSVPWLALAAIAAALVALEWLTFHFRWTE